MVTLVRVLEAVLGCGAISIKMTKPWGAGEHQKGAAAGRSAGTKSVTPGFELGLYSLISCVALALPLSHFEP